MGYLHIVQPVSPDKTSVGNIDGYECADKKNKQTFESIAPFPWVDLVAVNSNMGNFGSDASINSKTVNLIAIVGSKQYPENEQHYIDVFTEVAQKLNWELILEADDECNEDIVLCKTQDII